ncbi:MAG: HAMP domain-containing histidine kinase [Nitrospirae bacterium]|nr:HAMP domain-containing histidine kinase [Nitrospirota bacterium]
MPGGDGFNTFLGIKQIRPDLPVVMYTGHGSIELVRVFMMSGGQDFIQKPILDMETLDFRLKKVLHDVEREKQLSKELIAVRAKIESEAFKSTILASVSHELRIPLNHLMGFSQMLISGHESHVEIAQKIIEASERLNAVAGKIISAAAFEESLDITRFNMSDLSMELISMFDQRCRKKGLVFITDVPGIPVKADYEKLRQILENLIENAMKFTESGGDVKVSARQEDGRVVISVADTGIGIAEKDLHAIFERFGKVDHRTEQSPGVGLGLYLVKQLVEFMGAEISAESELTRGSVITVRLSPGSG